MIFSIRNPELVAAPHRADKGSRQKRTCCSPDARRQMHPGQFGQREDVQHRPIMAGHPKIILSANLSSPHLRRDRVVTFTEHQQPAWRMGASVTDG
jgi:hypothetical protein